MAVNIKDIAKLAGVSPSTVSRIVNGGDTTAASLETQAKIWDAVRKTNYVPNINAQNLKSEKNTPIKSTGKNINCVYARTSGPEIDPFFTALMHAAEIKAFSMGYSLRFYYSAIDIKGGQFPHSDGSCENISSVMVLGRVDKGDMAMLQSFYKNIICAGLNEMKYDVDQVISSGYDAASKCVQYLHQLGHERICYLGETENEQRYSGYVDTMKSLGFSCADELSVEAPFTPTGGYDGIRNLLKRGTSFTAVICANDISSVGVYRAIKEAGLKVPRDISVIGINDMETVRYLDPMLTTVKIPLEEMGETVAKILIDRIEGGHSLPLKIFLPNSLISRDSCAEPRN